MTKTKKQFSTKKALMCSLALGFVGGVRPAHAGRLTKRLGKVLHEVVRDTGKAVEQAARDVRDATKEELKRDDSVLKKIEREVRRGRDRFLDSQFLAKYLEKRNLE